MSAETTLLVLVCRRPVPGIGKQRLAASIGIHQALHVSRLLLNAALEDLASWPGTVVIAPAKATDADWARDLLPGAQVIPQITGNLGERIAAIDEELRRAGADKVLFIGSDSPGLTSDTLLDAARALDTHSTVLVPARDGGVILLGAATPWPALQRLPWETASLCQALAQSCADAGLNCKQLAPGYDVDTLPDLRYARQQLAEDRRPARCRLREWMDAHPAISVIIPVHQDEHALRQLLVRLRGMHSPPAEIIVVATDDAPECRQLCSDFGVHYIEHSHCRGAQLAAGASMAAGDILWFLHADSRPPRNGTELLRLHIAAGNTGGYFRFRFTGASTVWRRLLQTAINLRARFGIPYGDQGLFAAREHYLAAGGHAPIPLFEEVQLIRRLRQQGPFSSVADTIGVSPRRWQRDGWVRRTIWNRLLALGFMAGMDPKKLAHVYGQKPTDTAADCHQ